MVIFNSYVKLPEGNYGEWIGLGENLNPENPHMKNGKNTHGFPVSIFPTKPIHWYGESKGSRFPTVPFPTFW